VAAGARSAARSSRCRERSRERRASVHASRPGNRKPARQRRGHAPVGRKGALSRRAAAAVLLAYIAALALAAALRASTPYPPHHRLWLCIARYESGGNPRSSGHGHYGLLAMSWGWLGYIRGAASDYPQAAQEWAAERAWAAAGYSYSFLYGQWYEWDAADGCGTTG